jgi:hypothetical protein
LLRLGVWGDRGFGSTQRVPYGGLIDGSEAEGTVTFAFNGVGYPLDLSARNRDKLLKAFEPYIEPGRKVGARPSARRRAGGSRCR